MKSHRSKKEVKEIIDSIPRYLQTRDDPHGIGEAFWSAVTNSLYEQMHHACLVKSYGLTDNLGNRWQPLSNKTKAYKKKKLRAQLSLPNISISRPTLDYHQNRLWCAIFVGIYRNKRSDFSKETASKAASAAWKILKDRLGATTLLEITKHMETRILHETGALFESIEPTNTNPYVPRDDQIYRREGKSLVIGSKLPYANKHKSKRPIWPSNPGPWIKKAKKEGMVALQAKLKEVL